MAIDLQALRDELDNDPTDRGYTGDNRGDRDLLNEPQGTIPFARPVIPAFEIVDATLVSDFSSLTPGQKERHELITAVENVAAGRIDLSLEDMFTGSQTLANLQGLKNRRGSRAEELFGELTRMQDHDVNEARQLPPRGP